MGNSAKKKQAAIYFNENREALRLERYKKLTRQEQIELKTSEKKMNIQYAALFAGIAGWYS